ncbi:GntR family transcriptional regulator [Streptomyces canus]|uniref:GntR family transcriptional regulator n=1 Tax=Streptomyces canus TaxID=58343 RepID=UPI002F90CB0C|nr:GntR family transcriptional regulator [Streptomyces canus]
MAATQSTDIAAHYRRAITDGDLRPGDRLPTVRETAERFGVATATVTRAYKMLKAEGLTVPRERVGTVVAERSRIITGAEKLARMERTGKALTEGESTSDHWAGLRSCSDPDICRLLGVDPHDEIVIRRRVLRKDGRPVAVAVSLISMRALVDVPELLTQGRLEPFWQHTYTDRTGREITRSPEVYGARLASNDELRALEIDVPDNVAVPVLVLRIVHHDDDGPIEVWEDVHPPNTWKTASA